MNTFQCGLRFSVVYDRALQQRLTSLPLGEAPVVYAPLRLLRVARVFSPPLRLPPRHLVRQPPPPRLLGQRPRTPGDAARGGGGGGARVRRPCVWTISLRVSAETPPRAERVARRVVVSGEQPELVDFVHEVDEVGVERRL